MQPITSFTHEYRFLSNFWPARVRGPGDLMYDTVEHAYVASKSSDPKVWPHVASLKTPGEARRFGRTIDLRSDWSKPFFRIMVMTDLVEQKFDDPVLWKKLRDTAPRELIEGNRWGDTFWGQSPVGNGHNFLGRILMEIREDISKKGL